MRLKGDVSTVVNITAIMMHLLYDHKAGTFMKQMLKLGLLVPSVLLHTLGKNCFYILAAHFPPSSSSSP